MLENRFTFVTQFYRAVNYVRNVNLLQILCVNLPDHVVLVGYGGFCFNLHCTKESAKGTATGLADIGYNGLDDFLE